MDVLSIIKQEHRQVAALIDRVAECEPGDERLYELAAEIEKQLSMHLSIEERLFYSQLRDRAEEQEEQVDVFEAYTEHTVAKSLIELLGRGRKTDERFKAELQVLGEAVKHHVQEEESKVFGVAKDVLDSEELDEIGESWEKAKARAMRAAPGGSRRSGTRKTTTGTTGGRKKTTRR